MKEDTGRRLTRSEEARLGEFESRITELEEAGYIRKDLTADPERANFLGTLYGFLTAMPFLILFFLLNLVSSLTRDKGGILWGVCLIAIYFILTLLHELIHGLTWSCFAKDGSRSISFCIIRSSLNPCCSCSEPLSGTHYLTGLLMPWFVLGILPCILAVILHSGYLMLLGAVMAMSAGGDLLTALMILKNKSGGSALYLRHPTDIGSVCLEKE